MTTNVSISTGHRAAVVTITTQSESTDSDGNVERSQSAWSRTSEFIPPASGRSFTLSDNEAMELRELPEGINTMDDLRRTAEGTRLATADLDDADAKEQEQEQTQPMSAYSGAPA